MCETCGCGLTAKNHAHSHHHPHSPKETADEGHDHGARVVQVQQDVMAKNNVFATQNRAFLAQRETCALNLISSPGSGKTTLLSATLNRLKGWRPLTVVEGDLQTDNDARRIAETGVAVHQINTENACHLDAHMVGHALAQLDVAQGGVVFIENVGNLVCPASYDLGETGTVVLLSVTEGDDKPAKYPVAFLNACALVITKTDLLPHVDFSIETCRKYALAVNSNLKIFEVSARSGEGMEVWCDWIRSLTES
jgi:hydrogenase nickel incorporation protein HypB